MNLYDILKEQNCSGETVVALSRDINAGLVKVQRAGVQALHAGTQNSVPSLV